ncbi:MAG: hypothetical protein IH877_01120 [Gemmatimonadetes bacterium]|nr:hypothetical protein [Gemmatimonadota bacterium]
MSPNEKPNFTIRPFTTWDDYRQCLDLQTETWGEDFGELVPAAILKISQQVGGVAAGAFAGDDKMLGFVYGISGIRDGKPAHWSHMLAIKTELRDKGIGTQLKKYQRYVLLELGITTMYWTFDPLVARNAHFNLNVLGVLIEEYVPDMYGDHGCGTMDDVIGTDRFVVQWDLNKASKADACSKLASTAAKLIKIPGDIHQLKTEDPDAAAAFRAKTRKTFMDLMGYGFKVVSFMKHTDGSGLYGLEPPTE